MACWEKRGKVHMRAERNFDGSEGKSEQFVIILSVALHYNYTPPFLLCTGTQYTCSDTHWCLYTSGVMHTCVQRHIICGLQMNSSTSTHMSHIIGIYLH